MAVRPAERLVGKYSLGLFRRAQDAQRHHNLTFTFVARPSKDLKTALRLLCRVGLIAHVRAVAPDGGRVGAPRRIICTLRYLEGEPLVRVTASPGERCSYHDLARRAQLGSGAILLVWAEGALQTAPSRLATRGGGLLVASLTA